MHALRAQSVNCRNRVCHHPCSGDASLRHHSIALRLPRPAGGLRDFPLQALGIKPRQIKQPSLPKLGQQDLAQLLQRNPSGEDEGAEDPEAKRLADADRIKGLGYLP